jgi:hypothetical protein
MSEVWSRFIEILGYETFKRLQFEFGDEVLRIPKKTPKFMIYDLRFMI